MAHRELSYGNKQEERGMVGEGLGRVAEEFVILTAGNGIWT